MKDPQTGRTFYYHGSTGATQWNKPAGFENISDDLNEVPEAVRRRSVQNGNLQGRNRAWTEMMDPSTGKKFYYNKETGGSQWAKPEEADSAQEASAEGLWMSVWFSLSLPKLFCLLVLCKY